MTDKQIIETIKNISRYCGRQQNCETCMFNYGVNKSCQIRDIVKELSLVHYPASWNFKEIERLVNL